jgi:hypothetical protein
MAWGLWGICFFVVSGMIIHNWWNHSEGITYTKAVSDWWNGRDLYDQFKYDGFLYFPHAAILYTPFTWLRHPAGDIAWRLFGWAFLIGGIYRFSKLFAPGDTDRVFAIASFVAIAPALASLRNGQANLQIAAMMLQTAADLAERRWWRATLWLMIGFAVKPIMLVMILLVAALYRPMSWRVVVALVLFALAPFATKPAAYVWSQYHSCYNKMTNASQPNRAFCDLRGLLSTVGIEISQRTEVLMQLAAALGALLICWLPTRRWIEPWRSAAILCLTAVYLMLFNPRTESNSYVILSPVVGLAAGLLALNPARAVETWIMVAISFCFWSDGWAYHWSHLWLKQLACILFLIFLIREMLRYRCSMLEANARIPAHETA